MDPHPLPTLADSIAAAQAWWREAGVDLTFHDAPRAWLAPPELPPGSPAAPTAQVPEPAAPARERIGGDPANWPAELAVFQQWWIEDPSLDEGGLHERVAPRGSAQAALMIVVPMPEAEDRERLLSGPQGRLLAGMTRAMGLAAEEVYLAAALPRHMALPSWPELGSNGLGDVLRHHVALVAPKRVLVLGRDILSLFGHDPAQAAPAVSKIAIQDREFPLLSSYAPGRLLDHAWLRADLWRRWLDGTDGTTE